MNKQTIFISVSDGGKGQLTIDGRLDLFRDFVKLLHTGDVERLPVEPRPAAENMVTRMATAFPDLVIERIE